MLRGGLGDDQLYGGDNNDLMRGNGGVDSFDGGADDGEGFNGIGDRVSFFEVRATQGAVADLRTGVISNDGYGNVETMVGIESLGGNTAYADTFYGNDGRNYLFGDVGDNIYGFGGDDILQFASAPAHADGGDGIDRMLLLSSGGFLTPDTNADGLAETAGAATEGWFVNLLTGTMFDGYGNFGTVTGIENVDGSELADTIRGDNGNNVLSGLGGDDFILGMGGDDTILGGDGNDNLRGDNQLSTGGPFGNDILIGGAGDDLMRGGPGVDLFDGGSDNGTINNNFTGYGDRVSFYEFGGDGRRGCRSPDRNHLQRRLRQCRVDGRRRIARAATPPLPTPSTATTASTSCSRTSVTASTASAETTSSSSLRRRPSPTAATGSTGLP